MSRRTPKQWLLVCRQPPYGNALARAALDMALAAAAFEQRVSLLFMGDGVWQLQRGQDGVAICQKDFDRQLAALPLYDVSTIYVDAEALKQRGMEPSLLVLDAMPLTAQEMGRLMERHDLVLNF